MSTEFALQLASATPILNEVENVALTLASDVLSVAWDAVKDQSIPIHVHVFGIPFNVDVPISAVAGVEQALASFLAEKQTAAKTAAAPPVPPITPAPAASAGAPATTGTSQVNQASLTEYDNKPFDITNGAQAGETMLAPSDGSIPPARIAGTPRGLNNRYQLDPKNTGNAADYTQGPVIGAEADQLEQELAENGGRLPAPIHAEGRGPA